MQLFHLTFLVVTVISLIIVSVLHNLIPKVRSFFYSSSMMLLLFLFVWVGENPYSYNATHNASHNMSHNVAYDISHTISDTQEREKLWYIQFPSITQSAWSKPKNKKKTKSKKKKSKRKKRRTSRRSKARKKSKKRSKKKNRLRTQPALSLPRLTKALQRSVGRKELKEAQVSYLFMDDKQQVIASLNPDVILHPASNIKIATTAAAYSLIGPDFKYVSQWYTQKKSPSKGATSDDQTSKSIKPKKTKPILYWKASGDSKLTAKSFQKIAQKIRKYGIKRYHQLVIDDSDFTSELAPGFGDKPDDDAAYRAATGGIGYQFNAFVTQVKPGKWKEKPKVSFVPAIPYLVLQNEATTSKKGKEVLKIKLIPRADELVVKLTGSIPRNHKGIQVRRRIADPFPFAAQTFLYFLKKEGVSVTHGIKRGTLPLSEDRVLVAEHHSPNFKRLLSDINFYSNNYMAEQTLLTLGLLQKEYGGWQEGLDVVRNFLSQKVGIKGFSYLNGSGLFGQARFSTNMMVKVLDYMNQETQGKFRDLLPMMGKQGTVKKRLRDLPSHAIHAKTGTLDHVSSISGYLTTRDGQKITFSIIMNDLNEQISRARNIQNEMLSYVWLLKGTKSKKGKKGKKGKKSR